MDMHGEWYQLVYIIYIIYELETIGWKPWEMMEGIDRYRYESIIMTLVWLVVKMRFLVWEKCFANQSVVLKFESGLCSIGVSFRSHQRLHLDEMYIGNNFIWLWLHWLYCTPNQLYRKTDDDIAKSVVWCMKIKKKVYTTAAHTVHAYRSRVLRDDPRAVAVGNITSKWTSRLWMEDVMFIE